MKELRATGRVERKLTAVLVADVHGYTRLMERDDERTRRVLHQHRQWFRAICDSSRGRVIDTSGDGLLAEFASAEEAVQCAIQFQEKVAIDNSAKLRRDRMQHRIGVNIGDVLDDGASIYGDAVNLAARIQELAPPGGICVSSLVYELLEGRRGFRFKFFREQRVKNRSRSARVFSVVTDTGDFPGEGAFELGGGLLFSNEPGIAVLPFRDLHADADGQHLGEEMADSVIAALSRFQSVRVMARDTSFLYRDAQNLYRRLREELDVRYVIDGTIRDLGSKLRIAVRLVDCESARKLWADQYLHEASAIGQIQDEVASVVVSVLENRFVMGQSQLSCRPAPARRKAVELVARGNRHMQRTGRGDEELAERCFNDAIACDPDFSRAYSTLAGVYFRRAFSQPAGSDWHWMISRGLAYGNRAVELDEFDAFAHAAAGLGQLLMRDFDAARDHFDTAGELSPNDARILLARARAAMTAGEHGHGLALATRALQLNPARPSGYMWQMGALRFFTGQFDDCLHSFEAEPSNSPEILALRACAHACLGEISLARREASQFLEAAERSWNVARSAQVGDLLTCLERVLPLQQEKDRVHLGHGLERAGILENLRPKRARGNLRAAR